MDGRGPNGVESALILYYLLLLGLTGIQDQGFLRKDLRRVLHPKTERGVQTRDGQEPIERYRHWYVASYQWTGQDQLKNRLGNSGLGAERARPIALQADKDSRLAGLFCVIH